MHFEKSKGTLHSVKRIFNDFRGNRRWVPLFSHSTTSLNIWYIQELEGRAQFPFCWIDFENLAVVREVQQFYACATFKNQTFHSALLVPIWYLLLHNKNLHGRITDPIFSRFKISVLCKRNIFKIFHRHTRKTGRVFTATGVQCVGLTLNGIISWYIQESMWNVVWTLTITKIKHELMMKIMPVKATPF